MRTKEIDYRVHGSFVFGFDSVAAVKTGQPQPTVPPAKGLYHKDRRVAIHEMIRIHQTVITAGTTHLYGEYALVAFEFDFVKPGTSGIEDRPHFCSGHFGKVMPVHHHDWPKGASPKTIYSLQCKLPVRGCLTGLYTKTTLHFPAHIWCSTNMTGSAQTNRTEVPTSFFQAEGFIKCSHPIDIYQGAAGLFSDCLEDVGRQVSVSSLDGFENGDEATLINTLTADNT